MTVEPLLAMVGTTLADKYRLVAVLGSGGMGVVYRAEQIGLGGRSVAIKLLRRDLISTRFEWFRAEAMAASRINHPHAVAIYDFGITADEVPFLVMEHLRGTSLTSFIEGEQPSIGQIATIGAQVLSALDEAHSCGVVHCDLTADNVIVERLRDGTVFSKVIDFGLARLLEPVGEKAQPIGTAEYMAPEQIRGGLIQPATDLYAAGILLYEMISGRTPFQASSVVATLRGHLDAAPPPLTELVPDCPAELARVVARALSKDPAARAKSAEAMRLELLRAVGDPSAQAARLPGRRWPDSGPLGSGPVPPLARGTESLRRTDRLSSELIGRARSPVGRDREIAHIAQWIGKSDGSGALAVVGASGTGKSRVVLGLPANLAAPGRCLIAAADPSGLASSWYPILLLLEQALGLEGTVDLEQLERAAARAGLPDRDVPGLAELFAVEGPSRMLELAVRRREAHAAALRALMSMRRNHEPLVYCLVDFDKYDQPSREVVEALAAMPRARGVPRVIVTAERAPEFASEVVELGTLDAESVHRMVGDLVGPGHEIPDPVTIHRLTGGVPATAEQLAGWLALGHAAADLPALLVDVISVRVNRLDVSARRVLQAVAAQGTVAPRWVVEACCSEDELSALEQDIWTGLLVVGRSALTIPSVLARDTVWACTPADVRRRLNQRVLQATIGFASPSSLGRHAENAGELRRAYDHYLEAGIQAETRFDDLGASRWFERSTAMARLLLARGVPDGAELLIASSIRLARVLHFTNQSRLALGALEEAALHPHDDSQLAAANHLRGLIAHSRGKSGQASKLLQQAAGSAMRAGDRELLCRIYLDLAQLYRSTGDEDGCVRELEQAIDVVTVGAGLASASEPKLLWRIGLALADAHARAGRIEHARKVATDALGFVRRGGWVHARGRTCAVLAELADVAGDSSAALRYRTSAIEDMRALGDRRSTAELLLAAAEAARTSKQQASRAVESSWMADPAETMRAARRLADEIGWREGLARMRDDS